MNSRAKGHGFEREIAKYLNSAFDITNKKYLWKRVPMSGGFDKLSFPGDLYSMDINNAMNEYSIECKFYKTWKLEDLINGNQSDFDKWWAQACADADMGEKKPLLVFKKNNSKTYFMIFKEEHNHDIQPFLSSYFILNNKSKPKIIGLFEDFIKYIKDLNERNKVNGET